MNTPDNPNQSPPDDSDQALQKPKQIHDSASPNWHNQDNRLAIIAEMAYFKSEKRGFADGHEIADWLETEQELAKIMGEA